MMISKSLKMLTTLAFTVTTMVTPSAYAGNTKSSHISIGFIGDKNLAHVTVNDKNVITIKADKTHNPLVQTKKIAQILNQLLNEKKLRSDKILPAVRGNKYIARVDDKVIFSVDENSAKTMKKDPAQLTMKWVNNIRLALGGNQVGYKVSRGLSAPSRGSTIGYASWYGNEFHGRPTSSGELYNVNKLTAAHRTLPLGTSVLVTNVSNGRSVIVRINDRGPFSDTKNRIMDLSQSAFKSISPLGAGVTKIRIDVLK